MSRRRLDRLEDSLSPKEAVKHWLAEAHDFGSLPAYVGSLVGQPATAQPFVVLPSRVQHAVWQAMRRERPAFVKDFSASYADYDDRHRMPVGLTGLAQVVGLVGDTSIEERIKYDNLYIDQWSFGGDLQIMVKTVWSILRQPQHKREHKELESILGTSEIPVTTSEEEAV